MRDQDQGFPTPPSPFLPLYSLGMFSHPLLHTILTVKIIQHIRTLQCHVCYMHILLLVIQSLFFLWTKYHGERIHLHSTRVSRIKEN